MKICRYHHDRVTIFKLFYSSTLDAIYSPTLRPFSNPYKVARVVQLFFPDAVLCIFICCPCVCPFPNQTCAVVFLYRVACTWKKHRVLHYPLPVAPFMGSKLASWLNPQGFRMGSGSWGFREFRQLRDPIIPAATANKIIIIHI